MSRCKGEEVVSSWNGPVVEVGEVVIVVVENFDDRIVDRVAIIFQLVVFI